MAEALMSAEVDAVCGAGYGTRWDGRVNRRSATGPAIDTRAGTVELAIPKLSLWELRRLKTRHGRTLRQALGR